MDEAASKARAKAAKAEAAPQPAAVAARAPTHTVTHPTGGEPPRSLVTSQAPPDGAPAMRVGREAGKKAAPTAHPQHPGMPRTVQVPPQPAGLAERLAALEAAVAHLDERLSAHVANAGSAYDGLGEMRQRIEKLEAVAHAPVDVVPVARVAALEERLAKLNAAVAELQAGLARSTQNALAAVAHPLVAPAVAPAGGYEPPHESDRSGG